MAISDITRPGSVTFVVVLTWISAAVAILGGLALLVVGPLATGAAIATYGASGVVFSGLVVLGVIFLIIGLVTAAVATWLAKGANGARLIVTILQALQIVAAIATIIAAGYNTADATQGAVNIVIPALIIALLWNRRANEFFTGRLTPTEPA